MKRALFFLFICFLFNSCLKDNNLSEANFSFQEKIYQFPSDKCICVKLYIYQWDYENSYVSIDLSQFGGKGNLDVKFSEMEIYSEEDMLLKLSLSYFSKHAYDVIKSVDPKTDKKGERLLDEIVGEIKQVSHKDKREDIMCHVYNFFLLALPNRDDLLSKCIVGQEYKLTLDVYRFNDHTLLNEGRITGTKETKTTYMVNRDQTFIYLQDDSSD